MTLPQHLCKHILHCMSAQWDGNLWTCPVIHEIWSWTDTNSVHVNYDLKLWPWPWSRNWMSEMFALQVVLLCWICVCNILRIRLGVQEIIWYGGNTNSNHMTSDLLLWSWLSGDATFKSSCMKFFLYKQKWLFYLWLYCCMNNLYISHKSHYALTNSFWETGSMFISVLVASCFYFICNIVANWVKFYKQLTWKRTTVIQLQY